MTKPLMYVFIYSTNIYQMLTKGQNCARHYVCKYNLKSFQRLVKYGDNKIFLCGKCHKKVQIRNQREQRFFDFTKIKPDPQKIGWQR